MPEYWPNEYLLDTWPSAQPWGTTNLGRTAGTLYLTSERLIFDNKKGVEDHYTLLREIAAVYPYGNWPRIRVVLHSGQDRYYYALASRMASASDGRGHEARDIALARIWSAVASAHGLVEPYRG